jgi:hypothetical protein
MFFHEFVLVSYREAGRMMELFKRLQLGKLLKKLEFEGI